METPVILMPLPDHDFDPTEASIPWQHCTQQAWKVVISTETGNVPAADANKLKGPLPGLLSAGAQAQQAYQQMLADPLYQHPISYAQINPSDYTALILPGGDGLRMRQYLQNTTLQEKVVELFHQHKLVGAICHGILVLARSIDPLTGKSVLYGHKLTVLPKSLDRLAYRLDSLTVKHGYIMYPNCVAEEVRSCLARQEDVIKGPGIRAPFVVSDGNLVTSRWYMDAGVFAERFVQQMQQRLDNESYLKQ
jgi:putative intracellular protease/amidase